MKFNTYILDTKQSLGDLLEYVQDNKFEYCVLDVETNSKHEKLAKLWGISFTFQDDEAFYLPIRDKNGNLFYDEHFLKFWFKQIIKNKKLINHNIIYDALVVENNWGIDFVDQIYADTILMKHCIDEERPFGLKEIAVKYLGEWANRAQKDLYENIEANGGSTTKDNLEMYKADTHILGEYACWDTILCFKLFFLFEKRLQEEELKEFFYLEEVMPLYKEVTIPMKRNGFPVDVNYFHKLNEEITKEVNQLEDQIQDMISMQVVDFTDRLLTKEYPIKSTGNFPKFYALQNGIKLPTKNGKVTLAKKALLEHSDGGLFYRWLLGEPLELPTELLKDAQKAWYFADNPGERYIFNLNSTHHLGWLFFEKLKETPLDTTEKGAPKCDDDFLDSVKDKWPFVSLLIDYKKLTKLKSTYIEGVLERQLNGVIYASMLQFGTTSGRYSCTNPNLQNLPRIKDEDAGLSELVLKYVNSIKKGFIAGPGKKIVNADYSALEPRCFASMSGDQNLQAVFINNEDLYSSIAKRMFNLPGSVYKKDPDFIGKKYPEKRQLVKQFALAVAYGAEAGRISQMMNISKAEAQKLIDDYLNAYPKLGDYIRSCHMSAKTKGFVKTKFGRIRHLGSAKNIYEKYGDRLLKDYMYVKRFNLQAHKSLYKNMLNNSTNFPIQGLAAHVVNRAMIQIARKFKEYKINAYIAVQVHDEITCIADETVAEKAKEIVKLCMENTIKVEVPLIAEPLIGYAWSDAK